MLGEAVSGGFDSAPGRPRRQRCSRRTTNTPLASSHIDAAYTRKPADARGNGGDTVLARHARHVVGSLLSVGHRRTASPAVHDHASRRICDSLDPEHHDTSEASRGLKRKVASCLKRTRTPLAICCATVLVAGCRSASTPQSVAGVRVLYRSIGIDASTSDFSDICMSYMDEALQSELKRLSNGCSTPRFERWAEKVRLSKIRPNTRIVLSGREALIYDGVKPERALYAAGQWRLAEAPELVPTRGTGPQ